MTSTRMLCILGVGFGCAVLFANPAQAAPRSFSSGGVVKLTKTWGGTWGTKSIARLSMGLQNTAAFDHEQNRSFTYTSSYTSTWADSYLFNSRTVYWDITGEAYNVRLAPNVASIPESPDGSHAYGAARVVLDDQTLFSVGVDDYVGLFSFVDSQPRGISRKLAGGSRTYWIAGVIPVSIGGDIWGSLSVHSIGTSALVTNSGSSNPDRAVDTSWTGLFGTGSVWGQGFVAVGINGVAEARIEAAVNFFTGQIAPATVSERRACNPLFTGRPCGQDTRVNYHLRDVFDINMTSLNGSVWVTGELWPFGKKSETIGRWTGISSNINLYDQQYNEVFAGLW